MEYPAAMSVETYFLMRRDEPRPAPLAELSVVEVLRDVETDEGTVVPAGSRGTIVATWGEGAAYEIEFARPVVGLATVIASALRAA
jgi:hypothetical protein